MKEKKRQPTYSSEVCARAVRMVHEHSGEHASQWAAIVSIAGKLGCAAQTLHEWVKRAEIDSGVRSGQTSEERDRIKALELDRPLKK